MVSARAGTMASPEGAPPDFARLRAERRARLFDAMAAHELDALVLGRPANVTYASGARQLWTAGARPFTPSCVVVASTGRVHLLSTWDEGVPSDIAHDELYGLSWNPANVTASLAGIAGLVEARQVGTDGATPGFIQMLAAAAPGAALVDARDAIANARARKTADEVVCIMTATAVAEAALGALADALRPGVTERELLGVYAASIAAAGLPTPPTDGVVSTTSRTGTVGRRRRLASDRAVGRGDLVVLDPGAMLAGYEGGVGRTYLVDSARLPSAVVALAARCGEVLDAAVAACRPGARGADIRRASDGAAEVEVYGVGLGMEPPLITGATGDEAELAARMVLAVSSWTTDDAVGGFYERELVLVTDTGREVLSRFARGALSTGRS